MPKGKRLSKKTRAEILEMSKAGSKVSEIKKSTRVSGNTIRRVVKEYLASKNPVTPYSPTEQVPKVPKEAGTTLTVQVKIVGLEGRELELLYTGTSRRLITEFLQNLLDEVSK